MDIEAADTVRLDISKSKRHIDFFGILATWLCRGHVDEVATEPFLLLHCEHGTGYRRS